MKWYYFYYFKWPLFRYIYFVDHFTKTYLLEKAEMDLFLLKSISGKKENMFVWNEMNTILYL